MNEVTSPNPRVMNGGRRWSVCDVSSHLNNAKKDDADQSKKGGSLKKLDPQQHLPAKKDQLKEGLFLCDRTVAPDDPRLTDALESRTRIRRLTGFDATLMRDRVQAVKIKNDLTKGMAALDRLDRQRRMHEQDLSRALDAEKSALLGRLGQMTTRASVVTQRRASVCDVTEGSKRQVDESARRLQEYLKSLESQGGLLSLSPAPLEEESAVPEDGEDAARPASSATLLRSQSDNVLMSEVAHR